MTAAAVGFLLPEVLLPLALAIAGLAMIVGARKFAGFLITAVLIGAIAAPFVHSLTAQLPAPLRALMIIIGSIMTLGTIMRLLVGRHVWNHTRTIVLSHALITVGGAMLRSRVAWSLVLAGGIALALRS